MGLLEALESQDTETQVLQPEAGYEDTEGNINAEGPEAPTSAQSSEAQTGAQSTEAQTGAQSPEAQTGAQSSGASTDAQSPEAQTGTQSPEAQTGTQSSEASANILSPEAPTSAVSPEPPTSAVSPEAPSSALSSEAPTSALSLAMAVDIGWLDLSKAVFYAGTGGFTGLKYGDKEYKRIQLRRAMPVRHPSEFISVADHENKEIGMIHKISDLANDQLLIVSTELDKRYYCPEILEIKSVRDKLGYVYIEMLVVAGGIKHERSAAVNDVNRNIRMLDSNLLLIFDVDGNRYIVRALDKLDKKSLKRLEPYMF